MVSQQRYVILDTERHYTDERAMICRFAAEMLDVLLLYTPYYTSINILLADYKSQASGFTSEHRLSEDASQIQYAMGGESPNGAF